MGHESVGEPGSVLTLINRGWSLSNVFGAFASGTTCTGSFRIQPVQLSGMVSGVGSDSFCSPSFVHQGSSSERGRGTEEADNRKNRAGRSVQ